MSDNIYLPQANITFRSGAIFQNPAFPVIDDPNPVGEPGDIQAPCPADGSGCSGAIGDNGVEFNDAIDRCHDAWPAESKGIIAVQVNKFVDSNGERVLVGGAGYPEDPFGQDALGPRLAIADVAYTFPDTGFTWPEFPPVFGVDGDWQEKLLGHEIGHTLTLDHIIPLMGPTSDNLMQYMYPTDPDPAVSMFGTLLTASQASDVATFACSSIGGVQNCPGNPPALRTGSASDARGDVVFPFVDITAFGVSEDPFEQEVRLVVNMADTPALPDVSVNFFVDTDNDPHTGGEPTDLAPTYEGPGGVELAARTNLSTLDIDVFEFDGTDFAPVEDSGIEATLTPLIAHADDFFSGTSTEIDMGASLTFRIPEDLVEPFGDTVAAGVQTNLSVADFAFGELVLDAPTFPLCEVTPGTASPGDEVDLIVEGMPPDSPVIVYLGDERIAEGATDLTGFEALDFEVPPDARAGTRLVTVGVDDDTNAITADCEVEVGGDGDGDGPRDGTPLSPLCKLLLVLCLVLLALCLLLGFKLWKLRKGGHPRPNGYSERPVAK
jgi:hypothetical protein